MKNYNLLGTISREIEGAEFSTDDVFPSESLLYTKNIIILYSLSNRSSLSHIDFVRYRGQLRVGE